MADDIVVSQVFEHAYPFIREEYSHADEDGAGKVMSWRPGVRYETLLDRYGEPDSFSIADGMGKQTITVVSVHKPGRFPTRIFFTRQWQDPTGRTFGKANCRVMSIAGFRNLIRGYRHEVDRVGDEP